MYQKASKALIEQSPQDNAPENENKQPDPNDMPVKQKQRVIANFVRCIEQIKSLARSANVLKYSQALTGIEPKVWDSNPWLLGTKRGVIDLRIGTLRIGRPQDHIHTLIPTGWKGLDTPAPRFEQFLQEIFADREEAERDELIAFLQRVLGYGLTGHISERVFLMFYGTKGRNGTSTLLHVLEKVLDKAVSAVDRDVLFATERPLTPGAVQLHLANLQGKRIAWASESASDAHLSIDQIKQLTDGSAIVARLVYGKEFTFRPTHLLILLTGHMPEVDASDRDFWECLCPIAFNMHFVEKPEQANERQCDPNLGRTLEAEASGILAWLVRGTREWRRLGLAIPESVLKDRRQDQPAAEHSFQDFIRACCILDPQAQTSSAELYKRYKAWTAENGLTPLNHRQFNQEMKQVEQVTWQREGHGNTYAGVLLSRE